MATEQAGHDGGGRPPLLLDEALSALDLGPPTEELRRTARSWAASPSEDPRRAADLAAALRRALARVERVGALAASPEAPTAATAEAVA